MITKVTECPIAGYDSKRFTYINLGQMPLVNNLCNTRAESFTCPTYPLAVQYFPMSKLSCLTHNVDPELMFSQYSYKSGVVKSYAEHCKEMLEYVDHYLFLEPGDKVLDIGGNDGTLLKAFLEDNPTLDALNVDASDNMCDLSVANGIRTICAYWGSELAENLNTKFKLITSTNVFQHTEPLVDYVKAISESLDEFGIWCLEFPYWKSNMETLQYDQIYHEHVYYYLLSPINTLCKQFGLHIIKAVRYPIHGGTLRVLISKKNNWKECESVQNILNDEREFDDRYYRAWGIAIKQHMINCSSFLNELKDAGKTIVGFGAAAKGCIFLNSTGMTHKIIDVVIDDTDLKQGKFIPGTGIEIVGRDYLKTHTPDYILILAHNFKDVIIESLKGEYNGKFVVMFPEIKII